MIYFWERILFTPKVYFWVKYLLPKNKPLMCIYIYTHMYTHMWKGRLRVQPRRGREPVFVITIICITITLLFLLYDCHYIIIIIIIMCNLDDGAAACVVRGGSSKGTAWGQARAYRIT